MPDHPSAACSRMSILVSCCTSWGGPRRDSSNCSAVYTAVALCSAVQKPRCATIIVLCASTAPTLLVQVTLIHVYQAGMFADLTQIAEGAPAAPGEKVSSARTALQQEVQQKLQQLPAAVLQKAQQVRGGCLLEL